jgi:hypothetical protein
VARARPWLPTFYISERGDSWHMEATGQENILMIDQESGDVFDPFDRALDPVEAFRVARDYAVANALTWKSPFSLSLNNCGWRIGVCESGLGGQIWIDVSHEGAVTRREVDK